jgi:hypothetical protein
MWILLILLFIQAGPTPGQSTSTPRPPSLIVQVVDPAWVPVPGAEVEVTALTGNTQSTSNRTEKDGSARFYVPENTEYFISAKAQGFKNKRLKRVYLFQSTSSFPTAYVQLRLQVSRLAHVGSLQASK